MNKTMTITIIALVAVVMGMSTVALTLQQVEAQSPLKTHCSNHTATGGGGGGCAPDSCDTLSGNLGNLFFLYHDGDDIHDHDSLTPPERLICIALGR